MIYFPPYKQIGHFTGRETVYYNLNSNTVEGVGCAVLATGKSQHWLKKWLIAKLLPEPMLTYYQWSLVAITWW